jgi:hypothetical protein
MSRLAAVFVVLAFVLFASPAFAGDEIGRPAPDSMLREMPPVPETVAVRQRGPEWSIFTTWVSDYVALGYSSGAAIQTDLFAKWASGWSLDFWWSTGVNDFPRLNTDFADEFDVEVAKGWELENGLTITAGLAYFALFDLKSTDGDMVRPKIEVSYARDLTEKLSLSASAKVENLLLLPEWTSRWVTGAEVGFNWEVTEKFSVGASLEAQYDFGDANADSGWLITPRIGAIYQVNDWLSIEASFKHWELSGFNDGREDSDVFALKFSFDL